MRILLVADTHIGFDLPRRPRVHRRRRGHDFVDNFRRALQPALDGEADVVVHGGDLLHRSIVPPTTLELAMQPLIEVADHGVPVYLVPGNHERSRIPTHLWAAHTGIHIFDRPRTFDHVVGGRSLALSGFPFVRDVRHHFGDILTETGLPRTRADVHLLCMHQAVEGARVGPGHFTFRHGQDVVQGTDLPAVTAVVSGHIHRAQVLRRDLHRRPLAAPVIYPGSVERTSWAERDEPKGYVILNAADPSAGEPQLDWVRLPARPMVDVEIDTDSQASIIEAALCSQLQRQPPDSVVRVHRVGPWNDAARAVLAANNLRRLAPETMNIALHETRSRTSA